MTYDRDRLEQVCNGNNSLRKRILSEFELTTPPLVAQLIQSLDVGDAEEATRLAHTLKGSSRTIGGLAFGDLCSRVESQEYDAAPAALTLQIQSEFERLREAIASHLGSS